jgi:hypothetical protein
MKGLSEEGSSGALLLPVRSPPLNATEPLQAADVTDPDRLTDLACYAA